MNSANLPDPYRVPDVDPVDQAIKDGKLVLVHCSPEVAVSATMSDGKPTEFAVTADAPGQIKLPIKDEDGFEARYAKHLAHDEPLGPPREQIERHLKAAGFVKVACARCKNTGKLYRINSTRRVILCPNCSGEGYTWQQCQPNDAVEVKSELKKMEDQKLLEGQGDHAL